MRRNYVFLAKWSKRVSQTRFDLRGKRRKICLVETIDRSGSAGQLAQRRDHLRTTVGLWQEHTAGWQIIGARHHLARCRNDFNRRPAVPDKVGELQPVHRTRHLNIGEDDVNIETGAKNCDGFIGIGCPSSRVDPGPSCSSKASKVDSSEARTWISCWMLMARFSSAVSVAIMIRSPFSLLSKITSLIPFFRRGRFAKLSSLRGGFLVSRRAEDATPLTAPSGHAQKLQ